MKTQHNSTHPWLLVMLKIFKLNEADELSDERLQSLDNKSLYSEQLRETVRSVAGRAATNDEPGLPGSIPE